MGVVLVVWIAITAVMCRLTYKWGVQDVRLAAKRRQPPHHPQTIDSRTAHYWDGYRDAIKEILE